MEIKLNIVNKCIEFRLKYQGGGILVLLVVQGHAIFRGACFQNVAELLVSFSQFSHTVRNHEYQWMPMDLLEE